MIIKMDVAFATSIFSIYGKPFDVSSARYIALQYDMFCCAKREYCIEIALNM